MEYNIELVKKIILKSNLVSNIAIYNKSNEELFNNGIIIHKNELEKIKRAYDIRNKLFLNGIKINKIKYVIINVNKPSHHMYSLHCKKQNDGYICIIINNVILLIGYTDEYIPYQYDTMIQQIISEIEQLF